MRRKIGNEEFSIRKIDHEETDTDIIVRADVYRMREYKQ